MKSETEVRWRAKYPELLAEAGLPASRTAMCWGFECGDGWTDILAAMLQRLELIRCNVPGLHDLRLSQVKEKFGTLRVYLSNEDEWGLADCVVRVAEMESARTCEACGSTDRARPRGPGWVRTRCAACVLSAGGVLDAE